jgi:hypothetical protein
MKETSNPQYNLEIAALVAAIAIVFLGVALMIYNGAPGMMDSWLNWNWASWY